MSMSLLGVSRLAGPLAAILLFLTAGALPGCGDQPAPPPAAAMDAAGAQRDAGSTPGGGGAADPDAAPPGGGATPAPPAPGPVGVADAGADSVATGAVDPAAGVAVAPMTWGPCPDDMDPELPDVDECARLKVPVDYAKPAGDTVELLVGRLRARDQSRRIGSLFLAPNSPNSRAVSGGFLSGMGEALADEIRARFDVLTWDPRGVGTSAVDCKGMPSLAEIERTFDLSPQTTQKEALTDAYRRWVEACKANSTLLPFLGVAANVSDLEVLRRSLGDEKLTIIALSYGTNIGLHYLLRYPARVRAMALDAPYNVWPEEAAQQTDGDAGWDEALKAFFAWCGRASATDCPFARQTPDRAAAYDALVAAIKARPLAAPDFPGQALSAHHLRWAVRTYLYGEGDWPYLGAALEEARMGASNQLWESVDGFLGPPGPGADPYHAITCADADPLTAAQVEADAQKVAASRLALPYRRMSCVGWPVARLTPRPDAVPTSVPPVVLIGSTGDPRTPYRWAMAAASRLPGSTLITAVSYDHMYYAFDEPCIDAPVNAYLLEGKIPAAGIRCEFPDPVMEPEKTSPDTDAVKRWWSQPGRASGGTARRR
jgi:pimeloyl-ACP methyl ester carboxylesterase